MKKDVTLFLKKAMLLAIPAITIVIIYIVLDPFKVIWQYDTYTVDGQPQYASLNRDHVCAEMFNKNNKKYQYDSFIYGNSRSLAYRSTDWKEYVGKDASVFHFDASNESLYGISKKIHYSAKYSQIKNAIIILDYSVLRGTKKRDDSHLFYVSPILDGDYWGFHLRNFLDFINPTFFVKYLILKVTGNYYSWMKDVFNNNIVYYNPVANETSSPLDKGIISEEEFYNAEKMNVFTPRPDSLKYSDPIIFEEQKILLNDISDVLANEKTNFKIIISPLWDQIKMNPSDVQELKKIFGNNNVYDYSGINDITSDYHNYYESSHYRPHVAAAILKVIYNE